MGAVNATACLQFRPPPPPVPASAACACDTVWAVTAGRNATGRLHLAGSDVVLAGTDRTIYVVATDSGTVRWKRRLAGALLDGVTLDGETIYASTERPRPETVAIDLATGRDRWQARVGRTGFAPLLTPSHVLLQVRDGRIVALHRASGDKAWERQVRANLTPPALTPAGAVLATGRDTLFLLTADSGRVQGSVPSPGDVPAGWLAIGDAMIGGLASGEVVALDPVTLGIRWRTALDGPVLTTPVPDGVRVLLVTQPGTVWSVNPGDGDATTLHRTGRPLDAPPVRLGTLLLLAGADGSLRATDSAGRVAWRVNHWRPLQVAPLALPGGDLVVVGANGDLIRYAFP